MRAIRDLVARHKAGESVGITSVCSAHPLVIEATLRHALALKAPLALIEATSNQVVRAVHWGSATGNFLGRIDVARDAQKTDAAQDFKGLLLQRGASANAKPELEIFADDVKCAHGAAIGQMDEMAGYYMAARGIVVR